MNNQVVASSWARSLIHVQGIVHSDSLEGNESVLHAEPAMINNFPSVLYLRLDKNTSLELRLIPPGCFRMGSRYGVSHEQPVHWVQIPRSFYMGTYPVLQQEWRALVEEYPQSELNPSPSKFHGDRHPVERVSWHDATDWCNRLSAADLAARLCDEKGKAVFVTDLELHLGLPSEAEWEYACRAGTDTEHYTGDGAAALAAAGWFGEDWSKGSTHGVGEKMPNSFGLHDMHGNVDEWCHDKWERHAYSTRCRYTSEVARYDSETDSEDANRVIRGGSWLISAGRCRAAYRYWGVPGFRGRNQGFRVCLFLGPCQSEPGSAGVKSEPVPEDEARRQAAAKSQGSGGDGTAVDLSEYRLPSRSDGK